MDFQSAMETFAEAWVAANTKGGALGDVACAQSQAMALTRNCKTPTPPPVHRLHPLGESPVAADSLSQAHTPQQDSGATKDNYDAAKSSCGKSLPVHCVVEAVSALEDSSRQSWKRKSVVETDSYVIIPVSTAFHELVQVVLHRLGYPRDAVSAAKGSVIIKNWKPLSFDKIADGPTVTVGDILGELTTVATLRIQLYRARPTILSEMKEKLLRLLIAKSHNLLLSSGCPLDEVMLSQLCRGGTAQQEPSDECRRKFEQWWSVQVSQQPPPPPPQQQQAQGAAAPLTPRPLPASRYSPQRSSPAKMQPAVPDTVHPALQTVQSQYPTQKTRMRTSFDPELELPKLQRWFAENQHPSRQQIHHYVKELNGLESRRGRKPLDVNNVVYWFKNARAAQKRAELRSIGPGLACPLSLNGYSSNSHSPPGAAGLLLGQDGLLAPPHRLRSPGGGGGGGGFPSDVSDAEGEVPPVRAAGVPREYRDYRDPREELRHSQAIADVDDGRYTGSPAAPLSLTTGDKDCNPATPEDDRGRKEEEEEEDNTRTNGDEMSCEEQERDRFPSPNAPLSLTLNGKELKSPPLKQHLAVMDGIKQEPPDEASCQGSANNNNNNLSKTEDENVSEMEDEDEDDAEDMDDKRKEAAMDGDDESGGRVARLAEHLHPYRSPSPCDMMLGRGMAGEPPDLDRLAAGFPLVPNSMFSHSIMYMSHYIPGLAHQHVGPPPPNSGPPPPQAPPPQGLNLSALAAADERRKRNRTFIDPVTEVPRLEQWFALNTHPSHNLILKYTDELNRMPYRQKFPRLEPKNVQFWFKNRRAKCKRLKMSLFETVASNHHALPYRHQSPGSEPHRALD